MRAATSLEDPRCARAHSQLFSVLGVGGALEAGRSLSSMPPHCACSGSLRSVLAGAALCVALLFAAAWLEAAAALADGARILSVCGSPPPPPPPPNTLFVSIAAHHVPARERFLFEVIDEYAERFKRWRVDVVVDTNSAEFAARIRARYSPLNRGGGVGVNATTVRVNVWSRAELRAAVRWDGSQRVAADLLLAGAHRTYAHHEAAAHAFFVYSEDDVLLTQRTLELHAHRYAELWARGWTLGLVRAEGDPPRLPDQGGNGARLAAFSAPSGARYVQMPSAYAALYILDAAMLAHFGGTREWRCGSIAAAYGPRERFAIGFHWARGGRGGMGAFVNRALTPVLHNGSLDLEAAVRHLPANYAGAPRADAFVASDGAEPLPVHVTWSC